MENPGGRFAKIWGPSEQRMARLLQILKPWFDPRSRKPVYLIGAIATLILLGPLGLDLLVLAASSVPTWLRDLLGHSAIVGLLGLGLARIAVVRPGDDWCKRHALPRFTARGEWFFPLIVSLAAASLIFPLMTNPGGLGFADWDFVLDKYEAARRTVLEWHQFPWWNPWCRGGFPLAAEPQIGVLSLATPFVLSLGTGIGLRVATILHILIAVWGAYQLGRLWLGDRCAAALAAVVYALNGAVLVHTAQGYIIPMSYCATPWLAFHAFQLAGRPGHAAALGFWTAFMIQTGIQYLTLYSIVLASLIALRTYRVAMPNLASTVLPQLLLAAAVCLTISGWRIATVAFVLHDDQREQITTWDESIWSIPSFLLNRPSRDWPLILPGQHHATFFELNSYVGPVVVALAGLSLARGWRWWHTLALVCAWLAVGSMHWYQPSYWLARWPLFSSAHVVTRWRFVGLLGLAMAAGDVVTRWRQSPRPALRLAAVVALLAVTADYTILGWQQLPWAFSIPALPTAFPGSPVPTIINVRDSLGFPAVQRGYGVIRGYEPMLSYLRDARTLRKAREDLDYRGEAWTSSGPIEPVVWSPNRLVFQTRPHQTIEINQNPGSWWRSHGQPLPQVSRCAELLVPFRVAADELGQVDLTIQPHGLELGFQLHATGAALLAILASSWGVKARRRRHPSPHTQLGEAP